MADEDNVVALPTRGGGVSEAGTIHVGNPTSRPCSSTAMMVLGIASGEPTEVRCSLVEGHEGLHRVLMAWG